MSDAPALPGYHIERSHSDDLEALPGIERAALALFEPGSLPDGAEHDLTPPDELRHAHAAGLLWVARAPDAAPGELDPELAAIVSDEARRGLDPGRRVAMCIDLGAA